MSELIEFFFFALIITFFGYWAVSKVFDEEIELTKLTKLKLGLIVPFSILFPLALLKIIDTYAFLVYIIIVPFDIVIIKKSFGNELFSIRNSFAIYMAVALRFLLTISILGAIAKAITYTVKS